MALGALEAIGDIVVLRTGRVPQAAHKKWYLLLYFVSHVQYFCESNASLDNKL